MTRRLLLLILTCAMGRAEAQWSGSASAASDYRFRGVSLTDDRPAVQAALGYDDPAGWFAGAFASTIKLEADAGRNRQLEGHGGYAYRVNSRLSIEGGATYSNFGGQPYDYGEVFIGASSGTVSGRIFYSPDYFHQSVRTLYLELDIVRPIARRWNLVGHLGLLQPLSTACSSGVCAHGRFDWRGAVHFSADPLGIQLAWAGTDGISQLYPISGGRRRDNWLVIASLTF